MFSSVFRAGRGLDSPALPDIDSTGGRAGPPGGGLRGGFFHRVFPTVANIFIHRLSTGGDIE